MNLMLLLGVIAIAAGLYMAWNIGANDVANAMATSVGSKALTLKQALLVAAIFEFSGALLAGNHVAETVRKGIVDSSGFTDFRILMLGMVGSLLAAAIWLNLSTLLGLPVSTTHSIVGAVAGFGIVELGFSGLHWDKVITITLSWIISPFLGMLISFVVFWLLLHFVLDSRHPRFRVRLVAPFIIGLVGFILTLSMVYKGLKNLHLDLGAGEALLVALMVGTACGLVSILILSRIKHGNRNSNFGYVERIFRFLQVITACYVAFAHGANDNANAVGPMAAVISLWRTHEVTSKVGIPIWVLAIGGVGIVIGLATMGYKVMSTVGEKITKLTPSRGFSAEFGAATTVLLASKMGLPISTTHTLVGSVIGVGLARGWGMLNLRVLRDILASWFLTLPIAALLSALIFVVLKAIF